MSTGYFANKVTTINRTNLEKICPDKTKKFFLTLENLNIDFDSFCQRFQFEEPDINDLTEDKDEQSFILNAWKELQLEFNANTKQKYPCSLTLEIGYHDQDDGDCYDDVTGGFFIVGNVYQMTPAAQQIENMLEDVSYVVCG